MHEVTYNADSRMIRASTWVLVAGVAAMVCGLVLNASKFAFHIGAESLFSIEVTATLLLFGIHVVGIGVGYAGLGLLYDKRLCYAVAAFRLYMMLDLFLVGPATGDASFAALGMMLLIRGLEIAALIMLFLVGKHRWLFLAMAIWLFLRLVLDFIPNEGFAAVVGFIGTSGYMVVFGLAALAARRVSSS